MIKARVRGRIMGLGAALPARDNFGRRFFCDLTELKNGCRIMAMKFGIANTDPILSLTLLHLGLAGLWPGRW